MAQTSPDRPRQAPPGYDENQGYIATVMAASDDLRTVLRTPAP